MEKDQKTKLMTKRFGTPSNEYRVQSEKATSRTTTTKAERKSWLESSKPLQMWNNSISAQQTSCASPKQETLNWEDRNVNGQVHTRFQQIRQQLRLGFTSLIHSEQPWDWDLIASRKVAQLVYMNVINNTQHLLGFTISWVSRWAFFASYFVPLVLVTTLWI